MHAWRKAGQAGRGALVAMAVIGGALAGAGGPVPAGATVVPPDTIVPVREPSAFVPVTPTRVFHGSFSLDSPLMATVPLAAHVPAETTAVTVNFTLLRTSEFEPSVYACGLRTGDWWCKSEFSVFPVMPGPVPTPARSNATTLAVGPDRTVQLYGSPGTVVVVDLLGYYVPAGSTATAGRFRAVPPVRVLDTREAGGVVDGRSVRVPLDGVVPADAGSVLVTITAVDAMREGYVTAYPAGTSPPFVSNLLVLPPQSSVTNQAVVALRDGAFEVLQTGRSNLVVDLLGWFTSTASAAGADGLFVPLMNTTLPLTATSLVPSQGVVRFTPPIFGPTIGSMMVKVDLVSDAAAFATVWDTGAMPWISNLFVDRPGTATGITVTGADGADFQVATSSAPSLLNIEAIGFYTA